MQRAFIAGVILAVLLSLLGVFVILRRMSFFADGMAHASLSGVALGILLSFNPLVTALVLSVIFSFFMFFLEKKFKVSSDAAIGILFTFGMSAGVLLISLKPGYQPELISFLFGNILSVGKTELWIIGILGSLIVFSVFYFLRFLILLSLDTETAYVLGIKVDQLQLFLYIVLSISVVLGIKILGVLLVSALLVLPVSIAKIFAVSFKKMMFFSTLAALFIVILGIILSYQFDLPTGPVIVLTGTAMFFLMSLTRFKKA